MELRIISHPSPEDHMLYLRFAVFYYTVPRRHIAIRNRHGLNLRDAVQRSSMGQPCCEVQADQLHDAAVDDVERARYLASRAPGSALLGNIGYIVYQLGTI